MTALLNKNFSTKQNDEIVTVKDYTLQKLQFVKPKIIVIGASTGGPHALGTLLPLIAPHIKKIPVVIVLHMPADFVTIISSHIERSTGMPTLPAEHGQQPKPGHIYFAPGHNHLKLIQMNKNIVFSKVDSPPENFCKPSVDVLFRSAGHIYGAHTLGVILTGLGCDGLSGCKSIVEDKGTIIVQDEKSSVVWGMPGSVALGGYASAVLSLDSIASHIAKLMH
jgi:two-component system, chemotaxis family, protein-glutamate methylesterase/glutaminase